MQASSAKRQKVNEGLGSSRDDYEFELIFDQANTFRNLIDITGNVLKDIQFSIVVNDDFRGITVRNMDATKSCIVLARVACEVDVRNESTDAMFCIRTQTLLTCLKAIPSNYVMSMIQYKDSPDIHIKASSSDNGEMDEVSFRVNTMVCTEPCKEIRNLNYDFNVNMELNTLRTVIKLCKELGAETVLFEVSEASRNTDEGDGGQVETALFVTIEAQGTDVAIRRKFISMDVMESKDGQASVVKETCNDKKECDFANSVKKCSESFSTEYLNMCLRSMEKNVLNIRLSTDKPLVVNYPLDMDGSLVCLVIAAKVA